MAISSYDIINLALSFVGEDGTRFWQDYGEGLTGQSWCCMFVWDIFNLKNASKLFYNGEKTAYVPTYMDWADNNEQKISSDQGQWGDIVLFDWNFNNVADHIGFIVGKNADGTYKCVEGNVSNSVNVTKRWQNTMLRIYRPKYDVYFKPSDFFLDQIKYTNHSGPISGGDLPFNPDNPLTPVEATPYECYDNDGKKNPEIKNLRTNHKDGKTSKLEYNIDLVKNHIANGHDMTPFIYFRVNKGDTEKDDKGNYSGFELDTRSADSFKHYAISMENQKTGVGQGNQFKIKIAYHKHFSNYSNINQLEYALSTLRQGALFTNSFGNTKQLVKNTCILKYGYITNGTVIESPEYIGLLLKYSVTANKQIVEYTLEGFTGEQVCVNTVNWYPFVAGMDVEDMSEDARKAYVAILATQQQGKEMNISDSQLQDYINKLNAEYSGGISFQPFHALDCFFKDYNYSTGDDDTKFYLLDCTNKHRGVNLADKSALTPVHMSLCKGQTPIQYLEYCLGLFKYKSTNYPLQYLQQELKTSERFIYNLVRDPKDSKKLYVCVDVIDSTDSDDKVAYKFTGYSTDNVLLIDYNLTYDGTIALTVSSTMDESNSSNKDNAIYIDKDGSVRVKSSLTKDMFVAGEISEVLITKQDSWLDRISCANNCTMTTIGLPFEITVGTVFKCGLYITDTLHHTSGNCFVTGITDKISNNQFTTEFTMIRLPGRNSDLAENTVVENEKKSSETDKTQTGTIIKPGQNLPNKGPGQNQETEQ